MFFKISLSLNCLFKKKATNPSIFQKHLHFDVKSVIDSFPILLYEKVGHNGDQIEWTIYWHTKPGKLRRSTLTWIFCQTIVGSKFFIIMEASGRPKHTRIYSKPPIFSFKQQWKNFYNQIVHEVHIKIPASLIIQKLAFDNKEGKRRNVAARQKIGLNWG